MPFANRSYYDAAEKGRVDRDLAVSRQAHNALSNQQVQQGERVNALMADPQATPEAYARVGMPGVANALTNIDANRQGIEQEGHKRLFLAAQYALQSPDPKAFIAQNFPELAKANPTFDTDTPEQISASLQNLLGTYGAKAGIGPAQPKTPEPFTLNPGDVRFGPDGKPIASVAPKPEKAPSRFRTMNAQEIVAAGLPPGTAAQINDETGQISVISKRDVTATLSPKDQNVAKQKLITIQLAKKQLESIRSAFLGPVDEKTGQRDPKKGIKGSFSAGYAGQGMVPTEGGKKFDAAVDQMRSTLTALTRTPGVGAMSDYETKLDQAKFPSRSNYESVTQQQIDAIADQLALIENGYKGLLEGTGQPASTAPATSPSGQPYQSPPKDGPVIQTAEEAAKLPSGTVFYTPDGRRKVRP